MKRKSTKTKFALKKGLPPGNLEFHGEVVSSNSSMVLVDYSTEQFKALESPNIDEIFTSINPNNQHWISIEGLHNINHLKAIGEKYNIHRLVLEDILNTEHRPKSEIKDNYIFFVAKLFCPSETMDIKYEQISIILGQNYVITFQEQNSDVFDILKKDIQNKDTKIRNSKIDYLFYRILDSIVDSYYYSLEKISDKIEVLENDIHDNPKAENHKLIQELKRELIILRKSAFPLREAIAKLLKEQNRFIATDTITYLNDVYDHCIQVIDNIETSRDLLSSLMDLYMTTMSNKMNEVMKVLTIISTIFIPITFIAGVYGMNFEYMPELTQKWGYPITMIVMVIVVIAMLVYFKIKKWF